MKSKNILIFCSTVLLFFLTLEKDAYSHEESPVEQNKSLSSIAELKENTKPEHEEAKKLGSESSKGEALPPCKGGYSKVAWSECRGVKRKYNGPHFVGESYEGDFKEGRPHGQGAIKYIDGSRFVGSFEMGVREGPGKEFAKDGSLTLDGYWRAGVLVKVFQGSPKSASMSKEGRELKEGAIKYYP